jgi:outer membrane murein-binding lipoprotein Lpp
MSRISIGCCLVLTAALLLAGCTGIREQATEFRDRVDELEDRLDGLDAATTRNATVISTLQARVLELETHVEALTDRLAQWESGVGEPEEGPPGETGG